VASEPAGDGLLDNLRDAVPLAFERLQLGARRIGLVIVDEVVGFAQVGDGNLAPPTPNAQVSRMIAETAHLARDFSAAGRPLLAFLDTRQRRPPASDRAPYGALFHGLARRAPGRLGRPGRLRGLSGTGHAG
jgi:hypothetical protein